MRWKILILMTFLAGFAFYNAGCEKDKPESMLGKKAGPGEVLGEVLMDGKWELVYNSGNFTMSCKSLSFDTATGTLSGNCQCVAGCLQGDVLKRLSYTCTYEKDGNKLGCSCTPSCESAQSQELTPEPVVEPQQEQAQEASSEVPSEPVFKEEVLVSKEETPASESAQELVSEPVIEPAAEKPAESQAEPTLEKNESVSEPAQEVSKELPKEVTAEVSQEVVLEKETTSEPTTESSQEQSKETASEATQEKVSEMVSEEKLYSEVPKEEVPPADAGQEEKVVETPEQPPLTCVAGQIIMDNKCVCTQLSVMSNFGPYRCGNVLSWKGGAISPYTGSLTWSELSHVLCAVPGLNKAGLIINSPYVRNNPVTGKLELNPVEADVVQNANQEFVRRFTIPATGCTLQSLMFTKGTFPSVNDFCWPCHEYFTLASRGLYAYHDANAKNAAGVCSTWYTDMGNVNTCQ